MRCTRMVRGILGMVAVAAWLSGVAQAQQYHVVGYQDEGAEASDVSALRGDVTETREKMNTAAHSGYDAGGCGNCGGGCGNCGNNCCDCCNNCCCDTGGTCGCFEPCCHSSGLWVSAEIVFLRYHRADGVRVGVNNGEQAEFDFETTPRLTVGWVRSDGLGARMRYWEFDHTADTDNAIATEKIGVDTYTWDLETFDTFCLNRNWDLELAAGVRYCEFLEDMRDNDETRLNSFSGYGALVSAELRRLVGTSGAVFARARGAILMSDRDVFNIDFDSATFQQERLLDVTVGMTEFAFGYDYIMPMADGAYAFARAQAEWQDWYNFTSGFEDTANTERFAGPSDVGFGGYGFAIGVAR